VWLPLLAPAFMVSPGLVQKAYGAIDERALRRGVAANGVALMAFAFVPPLLGMSAAALHPGLASPDLALATVLSLDVPRGIGWLGLAAVFSAEVSSADAALFMLATSLSRDLYRRFLAPEVSDRGLLRVARLSAIAGGGAGIGLAIVLPTVVSALTAFYGLLTVLLFVPVVSGVHVRRAGAAEALAAMAAGVTLTIALALGTGGAGVSGIRPDTIGVAASGVAFGAARLATRRSRRD
jgi:SSS family solute:Na+ symporter